MCGFVVVFGKNIEGEKVMNALSTIRHRGPDEMGLWESADDLISLGHARLSIIDLKTGVQPLSNKDQSIVAVVNGEFYGFAEIRKALQEDGYQFKTSSDSEIILGLYERYGVRALKHLRGEFAFVLFDKRNQLVFAARDHFGIKPLFFFEHDHVIYFASEVKAFKSLGLALSFSEDNFYQNLCVSPNPEETLFSRIRQIPPAHYLIKSRFSPSHKLQSYWDFNYVKQGSTTATISMEDAVLEVRRLLEEAIKLRLHADVPVASYLSGGLDSCSILGIAQTHSSSPIKAYTLTFEHEDYNEDKVACEMAKHSGSPYIPIQITQNDIAHAFEDAVWHGERFLINGHAAAKFLLSKAVNHDGIKVVLTGEGSDEIFAGYAHFRQDEILYGNSYSQAEKDALLKRLQEANKISNGFLLTDSGESTEQALINQIGFFPAWMRNFYQLHPRVVNLLSPEIANKLKGRHPLIFPLNYLDIAGQIDGRDILSRSLYLWSKLILPHYMLTVLGDRMEMSHSIEGRVPFLDHKLVEFVATLPSSFKIKELKEKFILREAAKPFITKTVYERQKHPFLAPPAYLEKDSAMSDLIEDTLRGDDLKRVPFFDRNAVVNLLDGFDALPAEEKTVVDIILLQILSACLLQKRMSA